MMLSKEEIERYSRQLILPEIGTAGQLKLQKAKVLVIGAGGLGCPVVQYLAAAGIGKLGIVDGDLVEASNLQRQVLYTGEDIGQPKAMVAAGKMQLLNPFIEVQPYAFTVTKNNVVSLFEDYDLVIDGSDNFATRYLVNDACVITGKPLVFGSIFKFEGQVSVFNLGAGPTYRCVFPEPPRNEDAPDCATIGVIATLPGIVGTLMANEVIKLVTGIGETLSGRLLLINALNLQMQEFRFEAVTANKQIVQLSDYETLCASLPNDTISYESWKAMNEEERVELIDVRELAEREIFNIGGQHIPLSQLSDKATRLNPMQAYVLYCASGLRSAKAVNILKEMGFSRVMSLANGINGMR
jgi:adenylyltransferase/sulfurtransferase